MQQNHQSVWHVDVVGVRDKTPIRQICSKNNSRVKNTDNKENQQGGRAVIKLGNRRRKMKTENQNEIVSSQKKISHEQLDKRLKNDSEMKGSRQMRHSYLFQERSRKSSLNSYPSNLPLRTETSLKSLHSYVKGFKRQPQNEECSFLKCFQESAKKYTLNGLEPEIKGRRRRKSNARSKSRKSGRKSMEKLEKRLEKMKQYKFVQRYFTDLQLEGLFKKYQIAEIPEIRWPLLIVDQVYCLMKKDAMNPNRLEIRRDR